MLEQEKRIRLGDLADDLGVSTATVSLALRDSPLVAEHTRERIKAHAQAVGYIYNRSAASLRTSQSNMIGVAVHDILNPYFATVFRGLEECFEGQGKIVLFSNHRDLVERQQQFIETLLQHRVDGLVLCPAVGTSADDISNLLKQGVPVTLMCREVEGAPVPCVRGDDYRGSYAITKHLIEQGHQRIAMVGGRRASSSGRHRNQGWRDALRAAGINPDEQLDIPELMTQADGQAIAPRLLAANPRPTAVMCFNDMVALGVLTAVRRHGIEPGPDLAITGYDDTEGADSRTPALTTVDNRARKIGEQAAKRMLEQLSGISRGERVELIEPRLCVRESAPPIGQRIGPSVIL